MCLVMKPDRGVSKIYCHALQFQETLDYLWQPELQFPSALKRLFQTKLKPSFARSTSSKFQAKFGSAGLKLLSILIKNSCEFQPTQELMIMGNDLIKLIRIYLIH